MIHLLVQRLDLLFTLFTKILHLQIHLNPQNIKTTPLSYILALSNILQLISIVYINYSNYTGIFFLILLLWSQNE